MKSQTDPPSEEFEPLVKLRGKSLDQGLRRANLAAWLMPDADGDDLDEREMPPSDSNASKPDTAKTRDTGKRRGKPTTRRRWLDFFC